MTLLLQLSLLYNPKNAKKGVQMPVGYIIKHTFRDCSCLMNVNFGLPLWNLCIFLLYLFFTYFFIVSLLFVVFFLNYWMMIIIVAVLAFLIILLVYNFIVIFLPDMVNRLKISTLMRNRDETRKKKHFFPPNLLLVLKMGKGLGRETVHKKKKKKTVSL